MAGKQYRNISRKYSRSACLNADLCWLYEKVVLWAGDNLRVFPWRQTNDPYKVFLAECLLKRTTSKAALHVYLSMLQKYPDILSLALAQSIEEDLRPIGLYRQRGKLILQAARYVANELGGTFPRDLKELVKIPGIGGYGASAIASFAFNEPVPTIDSNFIRVLRRFLGKDNLDIKGASSLFIKVLKGKQSREFNFGIIDLGSMVCRPVSPKCGKCPLKSRCVYLNTMSRSRLETKTAQKSIIRRIRIKRL